METEDNDKLPERTPLIRFVMLKNGQVTRIETPWFAVEASREAIFFASSTIISVIAMVNQHASNACS